MPRSIMPMDLADSLSSHTVIDVRKASAFLASGMTVTGAVRRLPFDAENWWGEFAGRRVVVFCVHAHEVSRAVCGFLEDKGIDAAPGEFAPPVLRIEREPPAGAGDGHCRS